MRARATASPSRWRSTSERRLAIVHGIQCMLAGCPSDARADPVPQCVPRRSTGNRPAFFFVACPCRPRVTNHGSQRRTVMARANCTVCTVPPPWLQTTFFPKPGDMVLFPSWLPYRVPPNPSKVSNTNPRVTWAFNLGSNGWARSTHQ